MKKFLELISEEMGKGFEAAGYEAQLGRVTVSNRPDLCEYQCNGAMAGAKKYHKAPIMIANDVAEKLTDSAVFSEVSAVAPGFLNLKVKDSFVCEYLKEMAAAEKFGVEPPEKKKTIVVDYGGPNVAKPLHVGHLRSAVIGESIKRINRYIEDNVENYDLSLTALARMTGFNPSYLSRFYRINTGKKLSDQIDEAKLQHAKKLIAQGELVKNVAERTGFASPSAFILFFKRNTGVTPRQYFESENKS